MINGQATYKLKQLLNRLKRNLLRSNALHIMKTDFSIPRQIKHKHLSSSSNKSISTFIQRRMHQSVSLRLSSYASQPKMVVLGHGYICNIIFSISAAPFLSRPSTNRWRNASHKLKILARKFQVMSIAFDSEQKLLPKQYETDFMH